MDRVEEALELIADKALYTEDQEKMRKILRGEKLEETKDDATQ